VKPFCALIRALNGRARLKIGLAVLLTFVPYCVELARGNVLRRLFSFTATDAFYYLTVARNVATRGRVSFDGEHLTNGFHPLWQAMTSVGALLVRLCGGADVWSLAFALACGIVAICGTVFLIGLAMSETSGGPTVLLLLLPLGGATLIQAPLMNHFVHALGRPSTTLWGAVNGMESAIACLGYAATFCAYMRAERTTRGAIVLGVCLGFLSLARLDHALIAGAIAASLFVLGPPRRFALLTTAVLVGIVAAYVAQNQLIFGSALPISGALKSTFPDPSWMNLPVIERLVHRPGTFRGTDAQRAFLLTIPTAVALLTLLVVLVRSVLERGWFRSNRVIGFLTGSAVGVCFLFLYDFLFVHYRNQGHWYFPVSNLFVSVALVVAGSALTRRASHRAPRWAEAAAAATLSALVIWGYFLVASPGTSVSRLARFYFDEAPRVRDFYRGHPPKMVEYDDGIITFSTGIDALSGFGLAIDPRALHAARAVRVLDLGIERGYDRFSSFVYPHARLSMTSSDKSIRHGYAWQIGKQARDCRMSVEYLSEDGTFSIIRATCG
jgi:hypothetical protein